MTKAIAGSFRQPCIELRRDSTMGKAVGCRIRRRGPALELEHYPN